MTGKADPVLIRKPYGLAVAGDRLFICDPGAGGLLITDFGENTFYPFNPAGPGALKLPVNCCLDRDGALYVADVERKQVVVFDPELEFRGVLDPGGESRPTDVAVKGDSILVTDPSSNRVCVYDRGSLEMTGSFHGNAAPGEDAWLYNPVNLFVMGDRIYITDFGHSRIKVFGSTGEYLGSVGSYGRNFGQFVRPKGLSTDRDRNLYVVDAGFQNVQIFNPEGDLLMFFGGPYQGPGDMYLPAKVLIDYENLDHFRQYVDPAYDLEYLILVTNQYGPGKLNVYGKITPK